MEHSILATRIKLAIMSYAQKVTTREILDALNEVIKDMEDIRGPQIVACCRRGSCISAPTCAASKAHTKEPYCSTKEAPGQCAVTGEVVWCEEVILTAIEKGKSV